MKLLNSKKALVLLGVLVVAAAAAIGAYAYFSSSGHGTGSATVGTSTEFNVTSDTAAGGPLTPGGGVGTYETVKYRVNNPSTGAQNLNNVNIKVAESNGDPWSVAGTGGNPACTGADFELSVDGGAHWFAGDAGVDDTSLATDLAAGATTPDGTITIRMIDSLDNQDACKNATVPLYLFAN